MPLFLRLDMNLSTVGGTLSESKRVLAATSGNYLDRMESFLSKHDNASLEEMTRDENDDFTVSTIFFYRSISTLKLRLTLTGRYRKKRRVILEKTQLYRLKTSSFDERVNRANQSKKGHRGRSMSVLKTKSTFQVLFIGDFVLI